MINFIRISNKILMKISLDGIDFGKEIPDICTCDGKDLMPVVRIFDVPKEAKSLALIVEDPDAPNGDFVHFILVNIPVSTSEISQESLLTSAISLKNDFGVNGYKGPCPPSGVHRYFFKLFAIDGVLSLNENNDKVDFRNSILGRVISDTSTMATYSRSK